jgi:hypothetical protein
VESGRKTLALADIPPTDAIAPVGYNDPDRTGDREANCSFDDGRLWTVDAVVADQQLSSSRGARQVTERRQRRCIDQPERTASLYYHRRMRPPLQWETEARRCPRAVAQVDDELKAVLHDAARASPIDRRRPDDAVSSAIPCPRQPEWKCSQGGNVVDAAVAVSFALGVVEPTRQPGYTKLIYLKTDRPQLVEFMSRVPEDAGLSNTSLAPNGRLPDGGPVLVNVPGTVAAMRLAWEKFGSKKIPWADLLAPAIRAARDGYVVSEGLATTLATEREQFLKYEGSRALFFRDDQPVHAGDTLKNPDLAWTLEQIAKGGADAFYKGEVAKRMVRPPRTRNAMKPSDMARFAAGETRAGNASRRRFYSKRATVPGGAELAAKMSLLEQHPSPKSYADDAGTLHAMIAAWQLVPSTGNRSPAEPPARDIGHPRIGHGAHCWRCFDPPK